MFSREDIELIVQAMYKDELRNISEMISKIQASIAEIKKLNSGFKRYSAPLFRICNTIHSIMTRDKISDKKISSKVEISLSQKAKAYKLELEQLHLKKNEIEYIYDYIIYNIVQDDLMYAQNLILMRSIQPNSGNAYSHS